jgi:hypothetical protein
MERMARHVISFSQTSRGDADMMKRHALLGGTLSAVTLGTCKAQSPKAIAQNAVIQRPSGAKRVFDCLAALVEDVGALLYAGLRS